LSESAPWVEVQPLAALRDWLAAHHGSAGSAWVVTPEKGNFDCLRFPEVVAAHTTIARCRARPSAL